MPTTRLEAFSDGVLAIAITLLVLELGVPEVRAGGSLLSELGRAWPSYGGFAVSFITIGTLWINHHAMVIRAEQVDRPLLVLNLLLLGLITLLPWTTAVVAANLRGQGGHVALALYSANFLAIAVAFTTLRWWIDRSDESADLDAEGRSGWRFSVGIAFYAATIGLSFLNAALTLAVHGALCVYYLFDQLPQTVEEPSGDAG